MFCATKKTEDHSTQLLLKGFFATSWRQIPELDFVSFFVFGDIFGNMYLVCVLFVGRLSGQGGLAKGFPGSIKSP